jgi:transcriptional regulator with XRE-family HTH domain
MLPYSDRVISIERSKYLPSRSRGVPIPREPNSLGSRLRKRRLELNVFQAEAARRLKISARTLSLWECDHLYPTWPYWPRIVDYLGCDPFDNPVLGCFQSNKPQFVASLAEKGPLSLGKQIMRCRLEMKKSRKQLAEELGICPKTLWGWEADHRRPSSKFEMSMKRLLFGVSQTNRHK